MNRRKVQIIPKKRLTILLFMAKLVRYWYLAIIVLGVFAFFWYLPRKVIIKTIVCESQYGECSLKIRQLIEQNIGKSLFSAKKGINESFSQNASHNQLSFRYLYPSTLAISIVESKPIVMISNLDETEFRVLDREGNILTNENINDLPRAKVAFDLPPVGTALDKRYLFGLHILVDISKTYQISKGELSNDGLLVELPTKTTVLFPLEGDRDTLLGSFILIVNQLNSDKTSSTIEKTILVGKTIDLRFKNPVIR